MPFVVGANCARNTTKAVSKLMSSADLMSCADPGPLLAALLVLTD